jgi:hypothetical protein
LDQVFLLRIWRERCLAAFLAGAAAIASTLKEPRPAHLRDQPLRRPIADLLLRGAHDGHAEDTIGPMAHHRLTQRLTESTAWKSSYRTEDFGCW